MKFCDICGRPIEDDEDICVACKNPNEHTSFPIRPTWIIWALSGIVFLVCYLIQMFSHNYKVLFVTLWIFVFVLPINGYFELKYIHDGEYEHIKISDEYYKWSLVSLIVASLVLLGVAIFLTILFF